MNGILAAPLPPLPPIPPAPPIPHWGAGRWTAETRETGIRLHLAMGSADGRHRWEHSSMLDEAQLAGLGTGAEVRFEIRRDAGTFRFEGRLEGREPGAQGSGSFTFVGDPGFVRAMADLGFQVPEDELLRLALFEVSPAFVRELRDAGTPELTLDELVQFRAHRVTPQFVRDLAAAGFANARPQDLLALRIHRVDAEIIRGLEKQGYTGLSVRELVWFGRRGGARRPSGSP